LKISKQISWRIAAWLETKLAFSVAIFHEPEIVFLDEPTGGVDPVTRREFWNMIYQAADNGITILLLHTIWMKQNIVTV
jgi:ABC-2 type transport system ATP-binding protein